MSVTVKTLALAAGVSRGTVDRVLHNRGNVKKEVAVKIKALAKELGYVPNRAGRELSGFKLSYKIGVLLPSIGNVFFDGVTNGIEEAIREYEELGVEVVFTKVQGYKEDVHLKSIDELVSKGCSALCLATMQTEAIAQKIKECQKSGIKVILVNSDIEGSGRICYVGSDYIKAGKTCAGLLSLMKQKEHINILIVTGSEKMRGHQQRISGFKDELDRLGCDYSVVNTIESDDSDIKAQILVQKYLKENPKINCVYVTGAAVQGVGSAIIASGRKDIFGIAFDDIYTTVELVRAGLFKFVICQEPFVQGYQSIKRAYQLLSGSNSNRTGTDYFTETIIKIASNIG